MGRFVLGIKELERLHIGETDDFIQHIGQGAKPGDFDPQRVMDLANDWELYDEKGSTLGAKLSDDGTKVTLVPVDPPRQVSGAELVTRINYIVGTVRTQLGELLTTVLKDALAAVETVEKTAPDDAGFPQALKDLADSAERLRGRLTRPAMPVLGAELDVVLAAMTQVFGSPEAPPDHRGGAHDDWHNTGHSHS